MPFLAGRFERVVREEQWFNPEVAVKAMKEKPRWKTLIPGYQTIDLNFINYDNDDGITFTFTRIRVEKCSRWSKKLIDWPSARIRAIKWESQSFPGTIGHCHGTCAITLEWDTTVE